jgi:hypothetical protein
MLINNISFDKGHPFYAAWMRMRSRCNNPNRDNFDYYGGKGITVCIEWDSFRTFHQDMFDTWSQGLSLDRINNDKGYSKENCRWSTKTASRRNRSSVLLSPEKAAEIRKLHSEGKLQVEIARQFNVSKQVIWRLLQGETWNE